MQNNVNMELLPIMQTILCGNISIKTENLGA